MVKSEKDIPDWMRAAGDEAYWQRVVGIAVSAEDLGDPMLGHDLGECWSCDASRLRSWWEEVEAADA